ncbi:DNA-3-methyladenine glycosylase [Paenibacillus sp. N3/727]|uniref:DNA-3-methyladenine glycosylase n=1 Tax=Paenibacillus sp. N3/727 TaxID=2925845 RepID=UPI001F53C5AE|nr:DNA-3-methyladenine glycosylase [Paenibacillus sp. N3/727]UNK18584.1 DNA-3-methyladenine glycosylase [Paenibacillus sp. N3/727]
MNSNKKDNSQLYGRPLPPSIYTATALEAAPKLLGQTLVRCTEDGDIRCKIVETESYGGKEDKGSHAFGARRTARTEMLFQAGGACYVYLIYGMYHCVNVVTGDEDDPHAVLIRAVEPLTSRDAELMQLYRGKLPAGKAANLSNGPGKLCRALRIDKSLNGCQLNRMDGPLYLELGAGTSGLSIVQGPRINIPYAEEYAAKPWRFYIQENPYVSVIDKKNDFRRTSK